MQKSNIVANVTYMDVLQKIGAKEKTVKQPEKQNDVLCGGTQL